MANQIAAVDREAGEIAYLFGPARAFPALTIFLLHYLNFRRVTETLIVME